MTTRKPTTTTHKSLADLTPADLEVVEEVAEATDTPVEDVAAELAQFAASMGLAPVPMADDEIDAAFASALAFPDDDDQDDERDAAFDRAVAASTDRAAKHADRLAKAGQRVTGEAPVEMVTLPDGSSVTAAAFLQVARMLATGAVSEAPRTTGTTRTAKGATKGSTAAKRTPVATKGKGATTEAKRVPSKAQSLASLNAYADRLTADRSEYVAAAIRLELGNHDDDDVTLITGVLNDQPEWLVKVTSRLARYGAPHFFQ
jgi:hypothetical protein